MTADTVVRIDCHVHTRASFDASEPVGRVLESAADAGLDGVVVTDHDCIVNSREAAERAPAYGLVGIPGVEVSTADGHLLAIGVDSRPPAGRPFEATVATVRDRGGIAVVPHPFQRSRHGVRMGTITDCDGIEVFNAHSLTGVRNRQATAFARRRGCPRFGGSDAHRAHVVGRAYTAVDVECPDPTAGDVLDAMRAGRTRAGGTSMPTGRYVNKWAQTAKLKSASLFRLG